MVMVRLPTPPTPLRGLGSLRKPPKRRHKRRMEELLPPALKQSHCHGVMKELLRRRSNNAGAGLRPGYFKQLVKSSPIL